MTSVLIIIVLVAIVAIAAWYAGRTGAQKDVVEEDAKIKDKQLKAALERPADRASLLERLRKHIL